MKKKNIEISIAQKTIDLLSKYAQEKNRDEKMRFLDRLHKVNDIAYRLVVAYEYNPVLLADDIKKAIKIDRFRPKNQSITMLALCSDLDYVSGSYDTFDNELNIIKDQNEKRKMLASGLENLEVLAKQFSFDWMRRLKQRLALVDAARNEKDENIVGAYNKLFGALTYDFCKEYDCDIQSKLITNWDLLKNGPSSSKLDGWHQGEIKVFFPKNMRAAEKEKMMANIIANPEGYPNTKKMSSVYVCLNTLKEKTTDPKDLFYYILSVFAHEMHHALDFQKPRMGALGSQIQMHDEKTYVSSEKDEKAYYESASEISSYRIAKVLLDKLKKERF